MSLPNFVKQGSVLATPTWMSSGGNKLIFPRIFDNDAHRASLSGLPASSYSMLFSTDHSSGTGYIGRADADDLLGPWTDSGAAIHSGANQRETPHPVYDPVNNRVNVYVHDNTSTVSLATQACRLLTTTDLATLTNQGEVIPYGAHTGYGQYYYDSGNSLWHGNHLYSGADGFLHAHSTSATGTSFSLVSVTHSNQQHVTGIGNCFFSVPVTFQYGGEWYALNSVASQPRLTGYPANVAAFVAYPIVSETDLRPIGGYYTLVTPSVTTTDPDYRLDSYFGLFEEGGTLYLFYNGQNNSGDHFVCLATSGVGSSSQSTPLIAPQSDGTIDIGTPTTVFDWDAANDAFPTADLTMVVASGSDTSSQSVGNYYEMRYSSGSAQDLRLQGDATFDPRDHTVIDFQIDDLQFDSGDADTTFGIQIGWVNSITSFTRGFLLNWSSITTGQQARLLVRNGSGTNTTDIGVYSLPYGYTTTNLSEWWRANPRKINLQIHENGDKAVLLVDDNVAMVRDLSADGLTWDTGIFPYLRIQSLTPHPQFHARFTQMSVKTYEPPSGTAPTITTTANHSIGENQTAVVTMEATGDATITWSIIGGADQALFTIDTNTGALSFLVAPNYEDPDDADTNNIYVVQVRATNGAGTADQTKNITVTDVDETGRIPQGPVLASAMSPVNPPRAVLRALGLV